MVTGRSATSIAQQSAFAVRDDASSWPDEALIDRFLSRSGPEAELAFRVLVIRHGPMVLGVCRHVLNQHQEAEDAFQATFVVLARKADSIRDRRVLGRWLYEVAYRIAVRSRAKAVRRRTLERQVTEMAVTAPEYEPGWSELRPVIHEEVSRLPEKYRTPVILCYLEGRTNEEVAQLLHWPLGTVKGRLARARELLRSRLTRRGLALSAAFLLAALARETVFAEVVPSDLVDSSVRVAMRHAHGDGGLPLADLDLPPHRTWVARFLSTLAPLLLALAALAAAVVAIHPSGASWRIPPALLAPLLNLVGAGDQGACHL